MKNVTIRIHDKIDWKAGDYSPLENEAFRKFQDLMDMFETREFSMTKQHFNYFYV